MTRKIYEILEGSIALVALIGIVTISSFSVFVLNPNLKSEVTSPQNVAGEFTSKKNEINLLVVNNLSVNNNYYSSRIEKLFQKDYIYIADVKNGKEDFSEKFLEVVNPTGEDIVLNMNAQIVGNVLDVLKLKVSDSLDTLVLYTPTIGGNSVKVTIPANSKRVFNISFEYLTRVNFGFQVKIELK